MVNDSVNLVQVATVSSKGQVVIPCKVREMFQIKPGDQVLFMVNDPGFVSIVKVESMQQMINQVQLVLDSNDE